MSLCDWFNLPPLPKFIGARGTFGVRTRSEAAQLEACLDRLEAAAGDPRVSGLLRSVGGVRLQCRLLPPVAATVDGNPSPALSPSVPRTSVAASAASAPSGQEGEPPARAGTSAGGTQVCSVCGMCV
jgi:hypothetical protein